MKNCHLFVLPSTLLGGAERVLRNIVDYLISQDQQIVVYFLSQATRQEWIDLECNSNVTLISSGASRELWGIPRLFYFSIASRSRFNFQFVISSHSHINGILSLMRMAGLLRCKKLVSRESTFIFDRFSGIWRQVFKAIYLLFYGSQDLLIAQTNGMRDSLTIALGRTPVDKFVVIKNPISSICLQPHTSPLKNLGFEEGIFDRRIIVGCGRLIPLKGFDRLIEAFSRLSCSSDCILLILGEGPERARLEDLTERFNLKNSVSFLGHVSNPYPWFSIAEIGVVCSEQEGFPNTLLEMMASGTKKIITTPCTDGLKDIPEVLVTSEASTDAILLALEIAAASHITHAATYQRYVMENHSPRVFWEQVSQLA